MIFVSVKKVFGLQGVCVFMGLSLWSACGEDNGVSNAPAIEMPAEYTTFDVEWREGTVIQEDLQAVQDAIVSMDYETGILVFASSYPGLEALATGRTALIAGIGVFRITDKVTVDEGEQLTMTAVPITEVIANGTIAWRRNFVGMDDAKAIGVGMEETAADSIRQTASALSGSLESGELSASGKVGIFDTTFTIKKNSSGMDMAVTAKYDGGGNVVSNIVGSGTLRGLSNETSIVIEGSSVTDFMLMVDHVDGEINVSAGGVELGSGSAPIKIPAKISIPVVVGGIPFHVDLGGSLDLSTTLQANCSATIKGKTTFSGSAGILVKDGAMSVVGNLEQSELKFEKSEQVGTITAGLGVLLNFPEITVGVGFAGVASAEAYVKFSTEAITNMEIFYDTAGVVPVITGNCIKSGVNLGGFYGGKAEFLGFSLAESETQLFGKLGEENSSGSKCEGTI